MRTGPVMKKLKTKIMVYQRRYLVFGRGFMEKKVQGNILSKTIQDQVKYYTRFVKMFQMKQTRGTFKKGRYKL